MTDLHFSLIALGANITFGDNPGIERNITLSNALKSALRRLEDHGELIRSVSQFYSTPCFPKGAGPDYVNAVAAVETSRTPAELMTLLHEVEAEFGRERLVRWGQRTLDLDLIAFGKLISPDLETFEHWRDLPDDEQVLRSPDQLILPHPRMHERAFVLIPLADIDPNWRHPVSEQTVNSMIAGLPESVRNDIKPL